jgi:F-type H+-transporting ATPase subunit b
MDALLNPAFGTIIWSSISFLVVLFLLKRMAWGPILEGLKDREEEIDGALNAAKTAREQLEGLKADNDRLLVEARVKRDAMLKEGREMANRMVAEAKGKGVEEADRMVEAARTAIEHERSAAVAELKSEVAKLSLEIAEQLVRTQLAQDAGQQELVSRMISDSKLN